MHDNMPWSCYLVRSSPRAGRIKYQLWWCLLRLTMSAPNWRQGKHCLSHFWSSVLYIVYPGIAIKILTTFMIIRAPIILLAWVFVLCLFVLLFSIFYFFVFFLHFINLLCIYCSTLSIIIAPFLLLFLCWFCAYLLLIIVWNQNWGFC